MYEWHPIHDFVQGFGYREQGGDQRVVWFDDVVEFFGEAALSQLTADATAACLDATWRGLRPYQHARNERAVQWQQDHPVKFDKIQVPRIANCGTMPELHDVLCATALSDCDDVS